MPWATVICDYCGKKIIRMQRVNQLGYKHSFCDHKCERKYFSKSFLIKCSNCGKKIVRTKFRLESLKHHFCNRKCFAQFYSNRVKVNCANCGKEMQMTPCRIKDTKRFFCSKKCNSKGRIKTGPIKDYHKLPYEWGYLIGVICSDGCISKNRYLILLVKDKDFIEKFIEVVKKITNMEYFKRLKLNRKSYLWETTIYHRKLCNTLLAIGKYGGSKWEVPKIVLNGSIEIQRGFLNGFFDGDGNIGQGRNGRLTPVLSMTSLNKRGLTEISQLLLDFNVAHTLQKVYNKQYHKFYYKLLICRKNAVMVYWEKIGITMPRKKNDFIAKLKKYLNNVQYQREGYKKIKRFAEEIKKDLKVCAICNQKFIPYRPWKIYCCLECKEIGHRKTSSEYYYRKKREVLNV